MTIQTKHFDLSVGEDDGAYGEKLSKLIEDVYSRITTRKPGFMNWAVISIPAFMCGICSIAMAQKCSKNYTQKRGTSVRISQHPLKRMPWRHSFMKE